MHIKNITKSTVLADTFEECRTWWSQTRGMMFRKKVVPLVFVFPKEQIVRLDSWFCPGTMDLIFVDENWEVVEILSEWSPRSSYSSSKKAMFLLELPVGTIAHSRTEAEDMVQISRNI